MLERIRRKMKEENIDCLILTEEYNIVWAIQKEIFGYVFITQDSVSIIASNAHRHEITRYDAEFASSKDEYQDLLEEKADELQGNIKIDNESEKLSEIFNSDQTKIVTELRKIKTEEEIQNIRKACELTTQTLEKIRENLFEGINELEAVAQIQNLYAEKGVTDAFLTNKSLSLVNANCLKAHAEPRERIIKADDIVIVDSGCKVNNYCSDVTRTYSETPSEKKKQLFRDVKDIQKEILEEIEAGKEISKIVELRDKLVEEKGYAPKEHVIYSLGHSIGVQVHEKPSINNSTKGQLKEGMVVAIEPGLHVPGIGGVRIEDTVLVKKNGCEILSKASKTL